MKKTNLLICILLILIIALGVAIYLQYGPGQEETVTTVSPSLPPEPIKKAIVHYPVPQTEPATPAQPLADEQQVVEPQQTEKESPSLPEALPIVQESDQSIQQALENLAGGNALFQLLFMENFIQKVVVTIDNLPEKKLPRAHLPIKAPGGKFIVSGTENAPQMSARNYKRYSPYVELLEAIDQDLAIKIYIHFYPLFQSAYEQLGYKNAYFNDRLVFVIDHLLNTPNPADPILLAQPSVLYTYADPILENLSSGQKLLLRIGQEQRLKVFRVLDQYRQKLTNLHP
ncbi:MAG: DUF3014 domain-containing protein [Desulfuromonadales bacterium]|nr:DUF3014 domain-containing protein [Desulfuromonadales bacterium]MBN2793402.1 DUF3014 domain-containing protein [Desulfuromonadales bacterium]